VAVPYVLALDDLVRQRVCVGELIELAMAVDRQSDEHQREDESASDEKQPSLTLCHVQMRGERKPPETRADALRQESDTDDAPVLDDDEGCIDAADDHQEQDEEPQSSKELIGKARGSVSGRRDRR